MEQRYQLGHLPCRCPVGHALSPNQRCRRNVAAAQLIEGVWALLLVVYKNEVSHLFFFSFLSFCPIAFLTNGFCLLRRPTFFIGSFSNGSHQAAPIKRLPSSGFHLTVLLKRFPLLGLACLKNLSCPSVLSLHVMQLLVVAVDLEQLVVCATFHDLSFVEHAYLVSILDR